jgi:RNA polymerase sigma-70 factor (ECF subfamily)
MDRFRGILPQSPGYNARMAVPPGPRQFATTQWSLVAAATTDEASQGRARQALEQLCRAYWYPLYAFVRGRGHAPEDAQDLTQAFFARIIESGGFGTADRERGRFRSYLLGAMKHFLASEWHRGRALKRGGGLRLVEWDALDPETRYTRSADRDDDPELRFDREWALEITTAALRALGEEMAAADKGKQFEALRGCLTGEGELPRAELAERLGMSVGGVKVAVHRLRQRYRELLRATVAETVGDEKSLDEEMRYLVAVLRKA